MVLDVLKKRKKSESLHDEAKTLIPGGVNSPVRSFPDLNLSPLIVSSGYGDQIIDIDENIYIDYCGSWGALIHGHAHPLVVEAAQMRVARGSTFGITTPEEIQLAKKVTSLVPSIEKIRFVSSGTEATMSLIRLARGFTGKNLIAKFTGHYHGHADSLLVQAGSGVALIGSTSSSDGVPDDFVKHTVTLPFNDFEKTKAFLNDPTIISKLAAIIVEPFAANMGVVPPLPGFLEMVRQESEKKGILLIFDEVITGFRVGLKGAQGLLGIKPDLTAFGKIVGGGFPAAAFGGRKEIMDLLAPLGKVYQAGTLSGNPVAMAAGLMSLKLLETPFFYAQLAEKTRIITAPIKELIKKRKASAVLNEEGSCFTLFFGVKKVENFADAKKCDLKLFNAFFNHLFQKGIYFSPSQFEANFVSTSHTHQHLIYTRDTILEFLESVW